MTLAQKRTTLERFHAKVQPDPNSGCWLWDGSWRADGYGSFYFNGRAVNAHRASYEMFVGRIPDGLHIDHLCRIRCCVNPDHLEPVTIQENILRASPFGTLGKGNRKKTHCVNGHPLEGDNVRFGTAPNKRWKRRWCVICTRISGKKLDARRKGKPRARQGTP